MKRVIKGLVKRCGYAIRKRQPHSVTGYDLAEDLNFVIGKPAPVCIDIGANRGQTIEFLQKVFRSPRIYAIEPSGASFRALQSRNYAGTVRLYNFALGDCTSRQEFRNYENSCLSSFLEFDDHQENRFRDVKVVGTETVEVKTLDWFVEHNQIANVDLLKIDTQGYDLRVLAGASESLRRGLIENVLIELNFVRMYEGQSEAGDISNFLGRHGLFLSDYYEKVRQSHTLAWCTALFTKR